MTQSTPLFRLFDVLDCRLEHFERTWWGCVAADSRLPLIYDTNYASIETDYHHVDACTMYMVTKPRIYDVIVTTNMFGDIITDLGAAIQGGMGMAASGNINPTRQTASMFEPVHGSAPDIAGKNFANPIATFLSVAMMLDFLGESKAANAIEQAVIKTVREKLKDLAAGKMGYGTKEVGDLVASVL